jgi:hypothetical protein
MIFMSGGDQIPVMMVWMAKKKVQVVNPISTGSQERGVKSPRCPAAVKGTNARIKPLPSAKDGGKAGK